MKEEVRGTLDLVSMLAATGVVSLCQLKPVGAGGVVDG